MNKILYIYIYIYITFTYLKNILALMKEMKENWHCTKWCAQFWVACLIFLHYLNFLFVHLFFDRLPMTDICFRQGLQVTKVKAWNGWVTVKVILDWSYMCYCILFYCILWVCVCVCVLCVCVWCVWCVSVCVWVCVWVWVWVWVWVCVCVCVCECECEWSVSVCVCVCVCGVWCVCVCVSLHSSWHFLLYFV